MINEENFKHRGTSILIWQTRSKELYDAAKVVWNSKVTKITLENGDTDETHELYRPATLLMGLSLESLIKGLLIQNDESLVEDGKLDNKLKTHTLTSLFENAGIEITEQDQIDFLKRLTANVVWISKYAIPTKVIAGDPQETVGLLARYDSDFETFKRLYLLVESKYKKP